MMSMNKLKVVFIITNVLYKNKLQQYTKLNNPIKIKT